MTATAFPTARIAIPGVTTPGTWDEPHMSDSVRNEVARLSLNNDLANLRQDPNVSDEDFIRYLRNLMTPVRVSTRWPGSRRALNARNKAIASSAINADADMAEFATRLYDFTTDKWKRIKQVRADALSTWRRMSIDYPSEDGVRLMRRELVETFVEKMKAFQRDLHDAAVELNDRFDEILEEGRLRRGDAWRREDYPENLLNAFALNFSFPSVECATEMRNLNPELWMQECNRVREELDEALHRAESMYLGELDKAIEHILDKLRPNEDGSKKMLRETALTNIVDLVETFKRTNLGGRESVQRLTEKLEEATGNTVTYMLRKNEAYRSLIQERLQAIKTEVVQLKITEDAEHVRRKNIRQLQHRGQQDAA